MKLGSAAFAYGRSIPARHTCRGADTSPPLRVSGLPEDTVTMVLIVEDVDAPGGTWDHWVAYDIPPITEIPEGVESLGTPGRNSWRRFGYRGPCPPRGSHRYIFRMYALDSRLDLGDGAEKRSVVGAMAGRVIAEAALMGRCSA